MGFLPANIFGFLPANTFGILEPSDSHRVPGTVRYYEEDIVDPNAPHLKTEPRTGIILVRAALKTLRKTRCCF